MLKQIEELERNRRERPRIGDIFRAVDKIEQGKKTMARKTRDEKDVDGPEVWEVKIGSTADTLKDAEPIMGCAGNYTHAVTPPEYDKNTPGSLKQLRWAIYEAVAGYSGAVVMSPLNMKIEELFRKYTNS